MKVRAPQCCRLPKTQHRPARWSSAPRAAHGLNTPAMLAAARLQQGLVQRRLRRWCCSAVLGIETR